MQTGNLSLLRITIFLAVFFFSCNSNTGETAEIYMPMESFAAEDTIAPLVRSEEEWKKILTKEQYEVMRRQSTERAFTGELLNVKDKGIYKCAACGLALFDADTKFESGTGWPSFYDRINEYHVEKQQDNAYGMKRTEVHCGRCKGHLGHVFDDGPDPTGLRYCINSVSLQFEKSSN